jgi:hypothetical protein
MMKTYYVSRAIFAIILAALLATFGLPWWAAVLMGLLVMAAFILLARGKRFVVQPEGGFSPLRRDEMGKAIYRTAGLNGFVALVLSLAALTFYFGVIAQSDLPVSLLEAALAIGVVAYIITEYRMRMI